MGEQDARCLVVSGDEGCVQACLARGIYDAERGRRTCAAGALELLVDCW